MLDDPVVITACRGVGSFIWFPVERLKLIFQSGLPSPLTVWRRAGINGNYTGASAALFQRSMSTILMFQGQQLIAPLTAGMSSNRASA